ncbi:MAG: hypothetical protein GY795_11055 [Desulfobacterales bacterium]|nr:hypothetical protein [Desulfobacterales bacterium]
MNELKHRENLSDTLAEIRRLVEESNVPAARNILSSVSTPQGVSADLDNWRRALALPRARPGKTATGGSTKADWLWLEKHASEYKGQWVAVKDGILIGNHKNLTELRHILENTGKLKNTMLVQIEE